MRSQANNLHNVEDLCFFTGIVQLLLVLRALHSSPRVCGWKEQPSNVTAPCVKSSLKRKESAAVCVCGVTNSAHDQRECKKPLAQHTVNTLVLYSSKRRFPKLQVLLTSVVERLVVPVVCFLRILRFWGKFKAICLMALVWCFEKQQCCLSVRKVLCQWHCWHSGDCEKWQGRQLALSFEKACIEVWACVQQTQVLFARISLCLGFQ